MLPPLYFFRHICRGWLLSRGTTVTSITDCWRSGGFNRRKYVWVLNPCFDVCYRLNPSNLRQVTMPWLRSIFATALALTCGLFPAAPVDNPTDVCTGVLYLATERPTLEPLTAAHNAPTKVLAFFTPRIKSAAVGGQNPFVTSSASRFLFILDHCMRC